MERLRSMDMALVDVLAPAGSSDQIIEPVWQGPLTELGTDILDANPEVSYNEANEHARRLERVRSGLGAIIMKNTVEVA